MKIVLSIIAFIIQNALYIYIVLFMPQLFIKKYYSKPQILLTFITSIINIVTCSFIKSIMPSLNILFGFIFIFINFKFILKLNVPKSILLSIITFIFIFLAELSSYYFILYVFNISTDVLNTNILYCILLIFLQFIIIFLLSNVLKYILNKYTKMYTLVQNITTKQLVIFFSTLCICALPQALIFTFNN